MAKAWESDEEERVEVELEVEADDDDVRAVVGEVVEDGDDAVVEVVPPPAEFADAAPSNAAPHQSG